MEFITLAVPFVTTAIMFGLKKLAGLAMFSNGASSHPFLRFSLVLFSLLGIVSTSFLTGVPINPDSVSSLVVTAVETALAAGVSHMMFKVVQVLRPTR